MKSNIIHSIVVCLLAFTLPLMVACSSQEESLPDNTTECVLLLNIAPIEQTRAGTDDLPENEKMHSVRVVVLSNGKVEHNQVYSLELGTNQKDVLLPVKPSEDKKIFLFANEESIKHVEVEGETGNGQALTQFFGGFETGAEGFTEAVNKLYFAPQDGNIPMSSVYELKANELQAGKRIEKTFYVVRVMTKFTFSFINGRTDGAITVKEMTVSAFADKTYLMPHLHDGSGTAVASEQFAVVDNKKEIGTDNKGNTIYEPVLNDPYNGTYQANGTFWIDWLKQAVDWSQNETAGYTADQIGWIHQYSVPSVVKYDVDETKIKFNGGFLIEMGGEYQYPTPFYRCESGSGRAYQIDELNITYGTNQTKEFKPEEFPALELTNVKYLFRNTHVKVSVVFSGKDFAIFARVIPWRRTDPTPPRPMEPVN